MSIIAGFALSEVALASQPTATSQKPPRKRQTTVRIDAVAVPEAR